VTQYFSGTTVSAFNLTSAMMLTAVIYASIELGYLNELFLTYECFDIGIKNCQQDQNL
jgi:hypothetical protein